jgi:DNA relaxase NicK
LYPQGLFRGVPNTKEEKKLKKATFLIDWLTFTVKCCAREEGGKVHSSWFDDALYVCEHILKLPFERFREQECGRWGYRRCVAWNGIEILFDGGTQNMGLCVSMSGNACRAYEVENDIIELCWRVYDDDEAKPTRIDLACDDFTGVMNIRRIKDAIDEGELRSCIRDTSDFGRKKGRLSEKAEGVYIGSEKSELRFRIYDKAKERGDYESVWNRLEMVCRRQYAEAALKNIIESGLGLGECVAGMIAEKIAFIVKDDVNISRCSLADWWAEFLGEVSKLKMTLKEKPEMAVERLAEYFGEQLSACIWVCHAVYGDRFFDMIVDKGRKKAGKRHRQLLDDWLIKEVS